MQRNYYQDAADKLQIAVEKVLISLREQLAGKGLKIEDLPKEPMAVEIVSFALVKCLIQERLAFNPFVDEQQASQEAYDLIKTAVIKYRGANLVPPQKH